jgi:hypothetical protein
MNLQVVTAQPPCQSHLVDSRLPGQDEGTKLLEARRCQWKRVTSKSQVDIREL